MTTRSPGSFVLTSPALLAALVSIAGIALAVWSPHHLVMAGGVLAAYLAFCGFIVARHRARRAASRHALAALADESGSGSAAPTVIAYASQAGFAEQIAQQTAEALQRAGVAVRLHALGDLMPGALAQCAQALFVVSTTGEGDAPDSAAGFARKLTRAAEGGSLAGLRYGVLALGDRSYAHFCAFGHTLSTWLQGRQAQPLFDMVEVDNGDTGALRHWQNHLSALAGGAEIADWEAPRYGRWRLEARRCLNPGSAGAPAFHIALVPEGPLAADALDWQAGDIAEIGPRLPPADVAALLLRLALEPGQSVRCDGEAMSLAHALSTRMPLPDAHFSVMQGLAPQALIDALPPLPHREYSIASLPADGRIELLVRQTRHADGRPGLASGWLTEHAQVGDTIALRARVNRSFHAPVDDRPLILIGNGTGLAGLRALLKSRAAAGHHRNWLLFGERSAAHDAFHADDLDAWRSGGVLQRLDQTWSRDGQPLRYVQDAVQANAEAVRAWVADGASIYVCGSLQGMATGVHAALAEALGADVLAAFAENGRYRRDVY